MPINNKRGAQFFLNNLNPTMISVARELRGMTKRELAEVIDKTPTTITRIEKGDLRPDIETFINISLALSIEPSFFSRLNCSSTGIDLSSCHFRSNRSVGLSLKRKVIRSGTIIYDLLSFLRKKGINFPDEKISELSRQITIDTQIEQLTLEARSYWGLGLDPIPSIMRLIERLGVFVILLTGNEYNKVDAFSCWINERPCIFLCYDKNSSRLCFDLAHELGHLIMHEDMETGDHATERQANLFASSFLMPWKPFKEEYPKRWSLVALLELKSRWRVSISALLYRAKDLNLISQTSYKRAMITLSANNYRTNEPDEFEKEKPIILRQALDLIADELTLEELSQNIGIRTKEIESILLTQCIPIDIINKLKPAQKKLDNIVSFIKPT